MQFLINERILAPDQPFRALLLAPELRKIGLAPWRFDATIELSRGQGIDPDVKEPFQPKRLAWAPAPIIERIHLLPDFPAFTAVEAPGGSLEPGFYEAAARMEDRLLEVRNMLVTVGRDDYHQFIRQVHGEEFVRSEKQYEQPGQVAETWREAWRDVARYLGNPAAPHIVYVIDGFEDLTANELEALSPGAMEWIAFHLQRFMFDQVFYGGTIEISRPGAMQFLSRMTFAVSDPPEALPENLRSLMAHPKLPMKIELSWSRTTPKQAELLFRWNRG